LPAIRRGQRLKVALNCRLQKRLTLDLEGTHVIDIRVREVQDEKTTAA
jgi:hypothetical protein